MDLGLLITFLGSAALLYVALRYGIVGGGGGVSRRQERPISYWIGVALVLATCLISLWALIATTFFGGIIQ